MLYLEDYLEMIENLPNEFRYRITSIRELDLQVHNEKDKLEARVNDFFNNSSDLPQDVREKELLLLKQDYNKILEFAEEKIMLANALYDLVDKSLRRLDFELHKFKIELEADNAGITEILEKRSLKAETAPAGNQREKRKATTQLSSAGLADSGKSNSKEKSSSSVQNNSHSNGFGGSGPSGSGHGNKLLNKNSNSSSIDGHHHPPGSSSSSSFDNDGMLFLNSKLSSAAEINLNSSNKKNLSGTSAIAAAASQAIAATQQMPFGRRTASLKASFDAINSSNSSFSNFCHLNSSLRLGTNDQPQNDNSNGLDEQQQQQQQDRSKKSRHKRSRLSIQYNLDISNNSSNASDVTHDYNVNEPRYCYCNNVSYGEMIFCENKQCPFQWFHYDCVDIKVVPEGSWFCPTCTKKKKETSHHPNSSL